MGDGEEELRQGDKEGPIVKGSACLPLSMSAGAMPPLVQQAVSPNDDSRNAAQPQASPAVRRARSGCLVRSSAKVTPSVATRMAFCTSVVDRMISRVLFGNGAIMAQFEKIRHRSRWEA